LKSLKLTSNGRTQVLVVHGERVLRILLIIKLAPQIDTRSNRMWV